MKKHSPNTLSAAIIKSLKNGAMVDELEPALLKPGLSEARRKDETEYWDYKETLNVDDNEGLAKLIKYVLAFYNSQGGALFVGISNSYKAVGVPTGLIRDSGYLRKKLQKYIGSNVELFQDQVRTSRKDRPIWVIFVPKREGDPQASLQNTPYVRKSLEIRKGEYFVRTRDEFKRCVDPADYKRLFTGTSFKHLDAYLYERDDLYYRLLAPHCDKFIGRDTQLQKIYDELSGKFPVVSLDGTGGVGKSALAIQAVRHLYKTGDYIFIVSLSAKNRIWEGQITTRQAGFSGLIELLKEIATVLDISSTGKSIDELKQEILNEMDGLPGLLLIDNIEEITDEAIFQFLKDVPASVKILVTSRIERSQLGAMSIPIPEMNDAEARQLLHHELDRVGYYNYINEPEVVSKIVEATGRLPLAIKWAASLAAQYDSLGVASQQLRKAGTARTEFLNFCFTTMFDALSENAKNVGLLCTYLGEDWSGASAAVALGQPVTAIDEAIKELEDRGLIMANMPKHEGAFAMLPLTRDFLTAKWHANRSLRDEVNRRYSETFSSLDHDGVLFSWPVDEKIKVVHQKALEAEKDEQWEDALKFIDLGLQWVSDPGKRSKLEFLAGRVVFESGKHTEGLERMQLVLMNVGKGTSLDEEKLDWGERVLSHGKKSETEQALRMIVEGFGNTGKETQALVEEFCKISSTPGYYNLLAALMKKAGDSRHAYWIATEMENHLDTSPQIAYLGKSLARVFRLASKANEAPPEKRESFRRRAEEAEEIEQTLKNLMPKR